MNNKQIPTAIQKVARERGCNVISYAGDKDGVGIWTLSQVDADGIVVPSGMPYIVKLFKDGHTEVEMGLETLDILASLKA